jgi:hypothetical protein
MVILNSVRAIKKTVIIATMLIATIIVSFFVLTNVPSSRLHNCVWIGPSSEGLEVMNNPSLWHSIALRLKDANINCIIVWAGQWDSDYTINYADAPSVWKQFINTVKSVSSNFKILALVNGWGINVEDPSYKSAMLNSVKQLMASASFDGFNDDIENFTGTNRNIIDYWQAEARMIKDMGKIATVDLEIDWPFTIEDVYPYLTNFNYVIPMFYWKIEDTNALTYWNRILSSSSVPIIMGLDIDPNDMNNYSMSQKLSWIDQTLNGSQNSNLAGFSIWAYDFWNNADFSAWNNWATKNNS